MIAGIDGYVGRVGGGVRQELVGNFTSHRAGSLVWREAVWSNPIT